MKRTSVGDRVKVIADVPMTPEQRAVVHMIFVITELMDEVGCCDACLDRVEAAAVDVVYAE